ncbi:MAG: DUF2148 domain-containing protein [Methanomicrobiales archaeon]|nr:DUF2148 domain-containing protein [Methanomicrobiales archaeon]
MDFDEGLRIIASLMEMSAKTAPKGKGVDTIVTKTLMREELKNVATRMEEMGEERELPFFSRDAASIRRSGACVFIGCRGDETAGLNCGACGKSLCSELCESVQGESFFKPNCAIRVTDLGIAIGSAVKTASIHNVDNRILFSGGCAALSLHLLPKCTIAYAIPLSVSSKNIFFDRG